MKTSLARTIRAIQARPDGWLHVEGIRKVGKRVVFSLALREGRAGRWIRGWDVSCRGVREISVSDLDGGGIRLYRSSHPAARQYATRTAQLRCRPAGNGSAILGALAVAHVATVDDWIPVDRYLPMEAAAPDADFLVRAPDFLVRAYAKALRKLGVVVRVKAVGRKGRGSAPSVLHLGNSFVVAERFEATHSGAQRQ